MQLSGEEKRIQALFSELRFDDERSAPRFNALVNRGMTARVRPRGPFKLTLASAVVVIVTIAAILWSLEARLRQATAPALVASNSSTTKTDSLAVTSKPSDQTIATLKPSRNHGSKLPRVNRAQLLANKKAVEDAQAISKWASPTAILLSSSTGEVLTSLPQLNEKANQLKSFLPSSSN
jgi:hypothetical protein